ncbi:retron system putative HNH endonuclease [Variovorax sp. HJSM1_2]|uniref:retron system putative HNH endonuclease n=1 Tax=Variovorax sp. HJSM1_2 TaxID=3366263 RepID=UPI003BE514C9
MVELEHRAQEPAVLTQFRADHPNAGPADFDDLSKPEIKAALNEDQDGLCAYCEMVLPANGGQIDHIKPKGGANAHTHLCFTYTNYAHSCVNPKTCGQKKKSGLLPIEPGPGCNNEWELFTDGTIEPIANLARQRVHQVKQTRDMLGLNADSNLVDERKRWFARTIEVLKQAPDDIQLFLDTAPFRHILATAL